MANSAQANKRARQADRRNARNSAAKSRLRTAIKKVANAVTAGDRAAAETAYKAAVPVIDSASGKGLIHKNKAARHKSRLNTAIRALGSS